jgi:hypothetical protein
VVLAELDVRHTRRHQPTRRVALGDNTYLPTSGTAHGVVLLGAVVAEFVDGLDEEQHETLPRLLADARKGKLNVPRIALRHRLQTDVHGLDRSRHRIVAEQGLVFLELDVHGWPAPQVLSAVMAASALPEEARRQALRAIDAAVARPGLLPEGLVARRLLEGVPGPRPSAPRVGPATATANGDGWRGVPSERRWAMEVLGLRATTELDRDDVQRRFRRLLRLAHPDHGGEHVGAAERIAELTEARELLLAVIQSSAG